MMPEAAPYNDQYYATLRQGARRSAESVLPRVLELVGAESIVDFGCGDGTWLATATGLGVTDVLGVDGAWVSPETLQIPARCFRAADLVAPLDLGRRFDLAFCLEVAEHLPAEAARSWSAHSRRTRRVSSSRRQSRPRAARTM
jgi:2-polyprenyl-3-methyl-5-hydroxy-6-metoxy-1,4-benzoquinol methylase